MVAPIVIAAHPSRHESEPMELGGMLSRLTGAPLEVLGTYWFDTTRSRTAPRDLQESLSREVREALDRVVARSGADVGEVQVHAMCGSAATLVHELAQRIDAGLVVVGSTHRGAVGRTLGSTTNRVLDGAGCPVAVAPRGFRDTGEQPARVGVAFADTSEGHAALRAAAAIARRTGALLLISTFVEEHAHESQRERAEIALERAVADYAQDVDVRPKLLTRRGAEGLVEQSGELDLLVTGARAPGPMRLVRKLARQSSCPLVVIPRGLDAPLRAMFETSAAAAPPARTLHLP